MSSISSFIKSKFGYIPEFSSLRPNSVEKGKIRQGVTDTNSPASYFSILTASNLESNANEAFQIHCVPSWHTNPLVTLSLPLAYDLVICFSEIFPHGG